MHTEKEAAINKAHIIKQEYECACQQNARASVKEAHDEKRKAKACLKLSVEETQSNVSKGIEEGCSNNQTVGETNHPKIVVVQQFTQM